jgi:hypothetical protein
LPVSNGALARHLAWDSGLIIGWVAVPALGAWLAALGLVPTLWLLAWVLPAVGSLLGGSRAGAALGVRVAAWGLPAAAGATGVARVLATAPTRAVGRRLPPARWTAGPQWLALCAKDLRVTRRVGAVKRHLLAALVLWALSALAWRTPPPPPGMLDLAYVAAFVLALLGSAALGEWLVALSGSDPFATVRTLPVGVATVWGARFAWAILATGLLLLIHALAAQGLPHGPRHLFLAWLGAATLAVATLGVNYGVTLFPRADLARRLLGLSLGLAVAASLMIPLLGWVVLLAAVLHSARHLPYWSRLEEA